MRSMPAPRGTIQVGPVPIPGAARRVIVFGGTFDPPHVGHARLPELVRASVGFDWVLYVPAARSPHKPSGPVASDEDRVEMLAASLAWFAGEAGEQPRASISTIELDRARDASAAPSYTIDTLRTLREARPDVTLRLLIGADQAAAFARWREPREIIALAEPLVMLRSPTQSTSGLIEAMQAPGGWNDEELVSWRQRVVAVPRIDADATSIRAALASGGVDGPAVAGVLAEPVRHVIAARGLYVAKS